MMLEGIQVIGIAFGLFMVYMTYLYYKRQNYSLGDFAIWMSIWAGFLLATVFPQTLEGLVKPLKVYRLMDLLMIVSFMVLFTLIFVMYDINRRNEKKIDKVVREIALRDKK